MRSSCFNSAGKIRDLIVELLQLALELFPLAVAVAVEDIDRKRRLNDARARQLVDFAPQRAVISGGLQGRVVTRVRCLHLLDERLPLRVERAIVRAGAQRVAQRLIGVRNYQVGESRAAPPAAIGVPGRIPM